MVGALGLLMGLAMVGAVQDPVQPVTVSVDQTQMVVGDVVNVFVDVRGSSQEAVRLLTQPQFDGFAVVRTSQSSSFDPNTGSSLRMTRFEFRLRALTAGTHAVGGFRFQSGTTVLVAPPVDIEVAASTSGRAVDPMLEARLRAIIRDAPGPDGSDDVIVSVQASVDTIILGQQLDLVVVAWFPREIRNRLRTRPTLTPPDLQGAWTYSEAATLDVAETRSVNGKIYDLFLHHQAAFPLTPGAFEVGPASVAYSLPLRMSILSREVAQEVQSRPLSVAVLPHPRLGQPGAFSDAAASRFSLDVEVDTTEWSTGGVGGVTITLTGQGNVSLWPQPEFEWASDVRVYPGRTDVSIETSEGWVRGTKTFMVQVVPDSSGEVVVPEGVFAYYDVESGRYREARTASIVLSSEGRPRAAAPTTVVPLMPSAGIPWSRFVVDLTPKWLRLVLVAILPGLWLLIRLRAMVRSRWPRQPSTGEPGASTLAGTLEAALARLVPDRRVRDSEQLGAALRAAGVEAPLAVHAARVRDRLRYMSYGPAGGADPDELAAEVDAVLQALPGGAPRGAIPLVGGGVGLVILAFGCLTGLAAQTAEEWYAQGQFARAAAAFEEQVQVRPLDAALWFNLGAAYRAQNDLGAARAAWTNAARMMPRSDTVDAALDALGPVDPETRGLLWVSGFTPAELMLMAAMLWCVGWVLTVFRRRMGLVMVVAGLVVATAGFYVDRQYDRSVGVVIGSETPLRQAPYGTAQTVRALGQQTAVRIHRVYGSWLLVQRGESVGWVKLSDVARV